MSSFDEANALVSLNGVPPVESRTESESNNNVNCEIINKSCPISRKPEQERSKKHRGKRKEIQSHSYEDNSDEINRRMLHAQSRIRIPAEE